MGYMPLARQPVKTRSWYETPKRRMARYKLLCRSCMSPFTYVGVKRTANYYQKLGILCDECAWGRHSQLFS
jgi:hypothetical protein